MPVISGQHLVVLDDGDGMTIGRARPTLEHQYRTWDSARRRAIMGTPDEVARLVTAYGEAGVEELVLGFFAESQAEFLKQMNRFAAQVRPKVRC
jgi:alkanesulfonate monooxygenase SsuD/methylene tetrahydromethanopterin reductase-like flavin-dependent oxidoreductase (luciferase family)